MSADLILPAGARESLRLEKQLEGIRRRGSDLEAFDRALKDIDPRLSLVRASENATDPALTPGYWHVRRRNDPPAMDSYLILADRETGAFIEPHSGMLNWLRSRDLQNPGVIDRLQREAFDAERDRQKAQDAARDERLETFRDHYRHLLNPSVSFHRAG